MTDWRGPKSFDDLFEEWLKDLDRWVFFIDETKRPLLGEFAEHKQLFTFTMVVLKARQMLNYLRKMSDARQLLPEVSREAVFKGNDIFRLRDNPEFKQLAEIVTGVFDEPHLSFVVTTTQKMFEDEPSKTVFTVARADGTARLIAGPELDLLLALIRKGAFDLNANRVDVFIDRSKGLGLTDRDTMPLDWEIFPANLGNDPTNYCLISATEDSQARDLLLLPDFLGNMLVSKMDRTRDDLRLFLSKRETNWHRPVDLNTAKNEWLAAVQTKNK